MGLMQKATQSGNTTITEARRRELENAVREQAQGFDQAVARMVSDAAKRAENLRELRKTIADEIGEAAAQDVDGLIAEMPAEIQDAADRAKPTQ